jgi:hypothetical protein
MARPLFDEMDLAVYEAHSVAEVEGGAMTSELRRCHPEPLPIQRLTGMARRGLLTYEDCDWHGHVWRITPRGLALAEEFRAFRLASREETA